MIYEIVGPLKFKLFYEDDNFAPTAWGYYSKELKFKPNQYGYLVICLAKEKGFLGTYELVIESEKPISNIQESAKSLTKMRFAYKTDGTWNSETAGGNMSEITFYKNQSFMLECPYDFDANILLSTEESHPIGLYLFESGGKSIIELDPKIISSVIATPYLTKYSALLSVKLKKKTTYLLVPTTHKAKQMGAYTILIESTEKVDVNGKNGWFYKNCQTFKGSWTNGNNKGQYGTDEFYENPYLKITTPNDSFIMAHMYATEQGSSIGLHLTQKTKSQNRYELLKEAQYTDVRFGTFMDYKLRSGDHDYYLFISNKSKKNCEFVIEIWNLDNFDLKIDAKF